MYRYGFRLLPYLPLLASILAVYPAVPLQDNLEYAEHSFRNNGKWTFYEGTRASLSTGPRLSLIAAIINNQLQAAPVTSHALHAAFYLPDDRQPFLNIQEIEPYFYYFLDTVSPPQPWRPHQINVFSWPASPVIDELNKRDRSHSLALKDLGAVVRLTDGPKVSPDSSSSVVPVALYYSQPPDTAESYTFSFRSNKDMNLTASIYSPEAANKPLLTIAPISISSASTEPVKCNTRGWKDGWYILRLNDASGRVMEAVRFYHRRQLNN